VIKVQAYVVREGRGRTYVALNFVRSQIRQGRCYSSLRSVTRCLVHSSLSTSCCNLFFTVPCYHTLNALYKVIYPLPSPCSQFHNLRSRLTLCRTQRLWSAENPPKAIFALVLGIVEQGGTFVILDISPNNGTDFKMWVVFFDDGVRSSSASELRRNYESPCEGDVAVT
jgi:hypothetical protein